MVKTEKGRGKVQLFFKKKNGQEEGKSEGQLYRKEYADQEESCRKKADSKERRGGCNRNRACVQASSHQSERGPCSSPDPLGPAWS